jgi:hypothetical protein
MTRTDWRLIRALALLAIFLGGCETMEAPPTSAVGPQSSWEEIRGFPGLIPTPPTIAFGSRSVSVMDVCLGGDTLRATAGDGTALEKPSAGIPRDYQVGVGRVVGDAETSHIRILFYKPFTVPSCQQP